MPSDLIGTTEIADLLGISRQRVHQLRDEFDDFPLPVTPVTQRQATYWKRAQIERWARKHDYVPKER